MSAGSHVSIVYLFQSYHKSLRTYIWKRIEGDGLITLYQSACNIRQIRRKKYTNIIIIIKNIGFILSQTYSFHKIHIHCTFYSQFNIVLFLYVSGKFCLLYDDDRWRNQLPKPMTPSRLDKSKELGTSQTHVTIDDRAEIIKDKSATSVKSSTSRPTTPEPVVRSCHVSILWPRCGVWGGQLAGVKITK